MLRDAGPLGVHTFEMRKAFIGNPSQRINELEDEGFVIDKRREKLHGTATGSRYTLLSGAGVDRREIPDHMDVVAPPARDGRPQPQHEPIQLFTPERARPRGPYDEAA